MVGWCPRRCDAGVTPVLFRIILSAPVHPSQNSIQLPPLDYAQKKTATPKDGGRNIEYNLKIS